MESPFAPLMTGQTRCMVKNDAAISPSLAIGRFRGKHLSLFSTDVYR